MYYQKQAGRLWSKITICIGVFILSGISAAAWTGWVMNIVILYHMSPSPVTVPLILRIIGIFVTPLGMVLGWIPVL